VVFVSIVSILCSLPPLKHLLLELAHSVGGWVSKSTAKPGHRLASAVQLPLKGAVALVGKGHPVKETHAPALREARFLTAGGLEEAEPLTQLIVVKVGFHHACNKKR
jgi:hypothetical protein